MLVVLFWIFLFLIVISAVFLIVALVMKKKHLIRTGALVLLVSVISITLTLRSCFKKVKDDFGIKSDNRTEQEIEEEAKRKKLQLEKYKAEFDSIQSYVDSLAKK